MFLASDCVGQQLLCLLTAGSLAVVKMEKTNDVSGRVIFGAARTVPAVDAVPLAGLDMMLVKLGRGGLDEVISNHGVCRAGPGMTLPGSA